MKGWWTGWILGLAMLSGCKAAPHAITNAVIGTALAATASGVSRATGGCYASCPTGSVCNGETGLCEQMPCDGRCAVNERCEISGITDRCVPRHIPDLVITDDTPAPRDIEAPPDEPPE